MSEREGKPVLDHGTTVPDATARRQEGEHGIGARRRKVDGLDKATGRTRYTDDIQLPGMLHAKIKRSTRPHARILRIDTSKAEAMPGVLAVITGQDFNEKYGIIPWTRDEEPLCREKVCYVGDAVAAVAAVDLEFVVAKLAMKTGRPVKCLYTREEVFYAHRGRHPMRMPFTTGADENGRSKAVKSHIDIDGGAYASFGMITTYYAGQLLTGPVGTESYAFTSTRYYTNKPACRPKRGHGSVQPRFAFEIPLDMLAGKLGLDPIELRKRNFVGDGQVTVNGQKVDLTPVDLGAYSSRVTLMAGHAALEACRKLREKVQEVAEVEVDEETGYIQVHKIWVAHDCGRALNPILVEGQIEGSTYMGLAEVWMEEMLYGEGAFHSGCNQRVGMLVGPSLLDYRIPTSLDTPAIEAMIVEKPDPNGPYGAKEAGEGPLHSTLPAVANALYDAVGVRLFELPFTPAKVLRGLRAQKRERAAGTQAA